ncbi:hypothetical protein L6452_16887 [Arctium lappa]|uniref:Uncharacterized protein n=1 Tax=Arctium lappa TaxID=4217 RepID=A0ACB9C1R5_ARCLA|nr:hypothetical protein L6452_16887 [Arctium lappa]
MFRKGFHRRERDELMCTVYDWNSKATMANFILFLCRANRSSRSLVQKLSHPDFPSFHLPLSLSIFLGFQKPPNLTSVKDL